ncbi:MULTISPECIES: response regulator transcription factor [unclassified Nocardioides]|uniref:response regulator transcription factor n=1 Tax=unclassified Nocardioides TaxID=2615069 RepID=UPI0009F02877|nr:MULTISPECIES: response regulator transcription factor [unclassified Nocardioides]GAW50201.1 response regulator receiver [Nocardioides sp. PD653-B2]GAW53150.1 response regulator receiver [Nocardioides sp. PD653]
MAQRAVVVDDDDDISALIETVLTGAGMETAVAATGEEGLRLVRELRPDLVTLDVGLPDIEGTEVCRQLRGFSDAYVMMITSHNDELIRLLALDLGADDYLPKPFSPRELSARVAALLRRTRTPVSGGDGARAVVEDEPSSDQVVEAGGGLVLVPVRHVAMLDGEAVPLTPTEVDILRALASEPGRVWSRRDLAGAVWAGDFIESDYLVDLHVGNLRRKLRKSGGRHDWIRTVEGTSYALVPRA